MAFDAGSIVSKLRLNIDDWNKSAKEVKTNLKNTKNYIKENSAEIQRMGKSFVKAGAIIVGGLGLLAKKASDAEETTEKFGEVFKENFDRASKSVENLTNNYGLSSIASKTLLADTGDILSGFGFTSEAALDLSSKVQRMAVDLASFTNIEGGASRASKALTSLLVGQTEKAQQLGIVVRQDSIEFKNLVKEGMAVNGMSLLQAKAVAALTIATNQSKLAHGDYARTSQSTANQMKEMAARVEDAAIALGTALTPVLKDISTFVKDAATNFTEFSKKNPVLTETVIKLALGIGTLLTVVGSLMIIVPKVINVMDLMKTKMIAMKTAGMTLTPVIAGIAVALAVVTTATNAYIRAADKRIKELTENAKKEKIIYDQLRGYRRVASEEEKIIIATQTRLYQAMGMSFADASAKVIEDLKKNSEAFNKWSEERKKIISGVGKQTSEMAVRVGDIVSTMTDRIKELTLDEFDYKEFKIKQNFENTVKTLRKEMASQSAFDMAKRQRSLELIELNKEREEEITKKQEEETGKRVGFMGIWLDAVKKKWTEHTDFLSEMRLMRDEANAEDDQKELVRLDAWKADQETRISNELLTDEIKFQQKKALEEAYLAKRKEILDKNAEDDKKRSKFTFEFFVNVASQGLGIIDSLFQGSYKKRQRALNVWYNSEKKRIEESTMNEEEKAKAIEELDKEMEAKKLALAQKNAKREKAIAIAGAIMNTAQAVTSALTMKPWTPANFVMAGIAGAMGLAQVAVIASQPVPMAEGGMTKNEGLALLHPNEVVMPLEKVAEGGSFGGGGQLTVIFKIENPIDPKGFEDLIREKAFPIIQDALKGEDLLVHPDAVRVY